MVSDRRKGSLQISYDCLNWKGSVWCSYDTTKLGNLILHSSVLAEQSDVGLNTEY